AFAPPEHHLRSSPTTAGRRGRWTRGSHPAPATEGSRLRGAPPRKGLSAAADATNDRRSFRSPLRSRGSLRPGQSGGAVEDLPVVSLSMFSSFVSILHSRIGMTNAKYGPSAIISGEFSSVIPIRSSSELANLAAL